MGSEGLDELVAARILLVVGLDTGNRVGIGIGCVDHDVVGALDALPTVVAVHGPITARDGGNASVATGLLGDLSQEGAELTHVASAGLRVNVAAIHEGVDANGLDTVLGSHLDQSLDVVHVRMNTARAHKAHEVKSLAFGLDIVHSLDEDLVLGDGAVLDGVQRVGLLVGGDVLSQAQRIAGDAAADGDLRPLHADRRGDLELLAEDGGGAGDLDGAGRVVHGVSGLGPVDGEVRAGHGAVGQRHGEIEVTEAVFDLDDRAGHDVAIIEVLDGLVDCGDEGGLIANVVNCDLRDSRGSGRVIGHEVGDSVTDRNRSYGQC